MAETGKQFHHQRVALSLLPGQFQSSDNLRALVSALVGETHGVQELEDALWDTYTMRWLWIAEGAQLDGIGEILGEPRSNGLSDTDYRAQLYVSVIANTSQGEPDRIIEVAEYATEPTSIEYLEKYPATAVVYSHVITRFTLFYYMIRVKPAGVYFALIGSESATPFVFGVDRDASGTGFGSELAYGSGWGESGVGNESIGGDIAELFIGG